MLKAALAGPILAAGLLAGTAAVAQTMYGGYNLGPDYGAIVNQLLQQDQALGQRIRQTEAQVVQQAMHNPICQNAYQQHLAGGGQMPYPDFAYQCAATAGFTPDGMARFRNSEADNQMRERRAMDGLRQAEQARAAAQGGHAEGYYRNQQELGYALQGKSTWIDPNTGYEAALPHTNPGTLYVDPGSGNGYVMDNQGNYYVQPPHGYWYQMAPTR
ncbi:hypothetical protein [Azospirillum sp.]|uniref:hypothetical protein n=1 Tax=Azospirillum sp. TaxID=34012 RepID=UPI002D31A8FE|nr:hypothetical protein [Azospirillum sp.]HYD65426.1 hypothetical protein [Azospirillum sp.]